MECVGGQDANSTWHTLSHLYMGRVILSPTGCVDAEKVLVVVWGQLPILSWTEGGLCSCIEY